MRRLTLPAVLAVSSLLGVGAVAMGDETVMPNISERTVPAAKLVKAVKARDAAQREVRALRRTLATSPDAELSLQVAGIVYGQDWRHMQRCWLSEGYRLSERFDRRIVRLNRGGSGASGPAQFMPGTFASTPYGHLDLFNVHAQAMATGWMWSVGRRVEWAGVGC